MIELSPVGLFTKRLGVILGLTVVCMVLEVAAGFWTGSLALLAGAGHMMTNVGGLALMLFAIYLSEHSAKAESSYGYYRIEIVAALMNAFVLISLSVCILREAMDRFRHPPAIATGVMLLVATIGLIVSSVNVWVLKSSCKESLNMFEVYFEVLSDMLASIVVIIAAIIMRLTGWYYADPIIAAGIGLFLLSRTWRLLRGAVGVILEGPSAYLNMAEIANDLSEIDGIVAVHDLHAWTLTSGFDGLSGHIVVTSLEQSQPILAQARALLKGKFDIHHATIQIEV